MSASPGLNVGEATASGDIEAPVASFEKLSVSKGSENANLSRLPDEILLLILNHLPRSRSTLRSLALTCPNLRRVALPDFYPRGKYKVFRQALRSGDLGMVQRCALYGAAPVDGVWEVGFREEGGLKDCGCSTLFSHLVHRPIHLLCMGLDKDEMTADQCFEVLKWLVEHGFDITAASVDADTHINFSQEMKHMPCSLLHTFKMSADRDKLDGVAKMICYLSSQGFNFPRWVRGVGSTLRSREEYDEFTPLNYDSPFLVTMLMRSACPPSLLESFLKQLQRQGVKLTCPRASCPSEFRYGEFVDEPDFDPAPIILTQVWELVAELYNDLFDPKRWKPLYIGEVGDIWTEKVRLLHEYEGIDDVEKRLLIAILSALRKIEARAQASEGLDFERDAKACWHELCMAFEPFFDDDQLLDSQYRHREDRMHRFCLWFSWDPQRLWAESLQEAPCGKFYEKRYRVDGPVNVISDWPQKWRFAETDWLVNRDPDWCKIPLRKW